MVDPAFQQQVDGVLAALEMQQPELHRLRRVPIDLIADAVWRELAGTQVSAYVRVVAWKDAPVQRALLKVAMRNGSIVRAPVMALTLESAG